MVAAARHLIPALTPDAEAGEIGGYSSARAMIVKMILDRAPPADVVGGHAALRIAIDELLDAWEAFANDKRANAERLYYGYPREKALLHDPLDPLLAAIDPGLQEFTAGRSMRDVEHASALKITDHLRQPLTEKMNEWRTTKSIEPDGRCFRSWRDG